MSDDPEAKAAVIWMAGEYGQDIPDAPYVLESAVGSYSQVEFHAVLCECSVTKCFVCFYVRVSHVHMCLWLLSAEVHCIVPCCTVLHCTVTYCIVLHSTVLYCTVLYCTVLY